MKKTFAFCCAALLGSPAMAALVVDGNLADWGVTRTGAASNWTPNTGISAKVEDQTGGANTLLTPGYGGQAYDAEAFYATFQGGKLYLGLATGHNPLTVNNPGGNTYGAGDFAFDFGKNGSFDLGVNFKYATNGSGGRETFGVQAGVYANPTWTYGLWNAAGAQSNLANADKSHPTSLTGGTLIGNAALAYTTVGQNNYGQYRNDLHYFYELSVDTSLLQAAGWDGHSPFSVHWTQNCANDSIWVDTPSYVPEPLSLALMPLGLLGVAASRRRKKAVQA